MTARSPRQEGSIVHVPERRLSPAQQRGLRRLGDVVIPGGDGLPSFSDSGAADGIDRMLPYMYDADRTGLVALLEACARLPKPAIRALVALSSAAGRAPEPAAAGLRLANIGIKGVIQSLYWSDLGRGTSVHAVIGYDATINEQAYEQSLTPSGAAPTDHEGNRP